MLYGVQADFAWQTLFSAVRKNKESGLELLWLMKVGSKTTETREKGLRVRLLMKGNKILISFRPDQKG